MQKQKLQAKQARSVRKKTSFRTTWKKMERVCWQSGAASWCLRMDRNLVLIRLGRADSSWLAGMRWTNLAVFKNENFTAPVNGVIGKAGEPDHESYKISDRNQPQMPPERAIM